MSNEAASTPRHCPYISPACDLESRYDETSPPYAVVQAILQHMEEDVPDALEAAKGKIYRGESCQRCGAFFPAEG